MRFARLFALLLGLSGPLHAVVEIGDAWRRADDGQSSLLRCCIHTGSRYLAVGEAGVVLSSPDGEAWTLHEVPIQDQLNSIAWNGSRAVAVGASSSCLVSSDGIEWQRRSLGVNVTFNSVTWTGTRFVAVGASGTIVSSPDGMNWAAEATGVTVPLVSVCASGNELVAAGGGSGSHFILKSSVPGIWTSSSAPAVAATAVLGASPTKVIFGQSTSGFIRAVQGGPWQSCPYARHENLAPASIGSNGAAFVAVGASGMIASSPDGDSWTQMSVPVSHNLVSVFWRDSGWEAVSARREVLRSADGLHWTTRPLENIQDTAWNGTIHVAVGRKGCIATSADGIVWTSQMPPSFGNDLRAVEWNGSVFVAVGVAGTVLRSADGVNWSESHQGTIDLRDLAWQGNRFLAVGGTGAILSSPDGLDWHFSDPGGLDAVAWDGTRYLATREKQVLVSQDGNLWRILSTVPVNKVQKILWNGSLYVAAGSGAMLSSPDGITWASNKPPGFDFSSTTWNDVAGSGSSYVAVGSFGEVAVSSDGLAWTGTKGSPRYVKVVRGASRWVAMSDSGAIYRSDDGVAWVLDTLPAGPPQMTSLAAGNGVFLGLGAKSGVPTVLRSTDGISWVQKTVGGTGAVNSAAWTGSAFVATLSDGSFATSPDGQTWTLQAGTAGRIYDSCLWTGSQVLAWNAAGASTSSPDGAAWTHGSKRAGSGSLVALAFSGDLCVAREEYRLAVNHGGDDWEGRPVNFASQSIRDFCFASGLLHVLTASDIYTSPDSVTWTPHPAGDPKQGSTNRIFAGASGVLLVNRDEMWRLNASNQWVKVSEAGASYGFSVGDGKIFALNSSSAAAVSTDDGLTWTDLGGQQPTQNMTSVVPTANGFLATGSLGVIYKSGDEGLSWQKLPLELPGIQSLTTNGNSIVASSGAEIFTSADEGVTWSSYQPASGSSITKMEWTGSEFLALGTKSYSSPDGTTWTALPALNGYSSVKSGGGLLMANQGRTTYHGSSLGSMQATPGYNFLSLASSGSRYVAAMGNPVYSTDGETWTAVSPAISAQAVVWTGSRFVAVGDLNTGGYSADGVTWTSVNGARGTAVIWTGSKLFALDSGTIRSSPDGTTWTVAMSTVNQPLLGAVWTGSFGVAVGWAGTVVRTADGITWTQVTPGLSGNYRSVAWSGTHLVAVGDAGKIARSTDGLVWEAVPAPVTLSQSAAHYLGGADVRSVIWTGDQFVMAALHGQIFSSPDGLIWTERFVDRNFWLLGLHASPGKIFAYGRCGALLFSADGITWERVSRGIGSGETSGSGSYSEKFEIKASSGSTFVALGELGTLLSTNDGKVWHEASYYYGGDEPQDVAWAGDRFIMVGTAARIFSSKDGRMWLPKTSGSSTNLTGVAAKGNVAVAVGERVTILRSEAGVSAPWTYEGWSRDLPPGMDAMEDDPYNSGIPNLLAYAMGFPAGGPPSGEDRARLLKLVGGTEIQFLLPPIERFDIRYGIERSTNLTSWSSVGTRMRGLWFPSGSNTILESPSSQGRVVRVPVPTPSGAAGFYRLSVIETSGL